MPMPQWTVLQLDPTTNEDDLRRTLANKLKKQYRIIRIGNTFQVGVLDERDVLTVQESFDVTDKRFTSMFDGQSAYLATQ